jgi:hypothetical protein
MRDIRHQPSEMRLPKPPADSLRVPRTEACSRVHRALKFDLFETALLGLSTKRNKIFVVAAFSIDI